MGEALFDTNWLMNLYKERKKDEKGNTTILNIIEYPKAIDYFTNIEIKFPSNNDFATSVYLSKELLKIGKPLPSMDIIIASICRNLNLTLNTYDKHFNVIKEVWEDFKLNLVV